MEQISFFSASGTSIMPTENEFDAISGVNVVASIATVTSELSEYFRRHVRQREVLEVLRGYNTVMEIKRRFKERYQTDPAFRDECAKARSGQRYVTGFVRTWIADIIKTKLAAAHILLPIDFRATGLPIAHGRVAPAGDAA